MNHRSPVRVFGILVLSILLAGLLTYAARIVWGTDIQVQVDSSDDDIFMTSSSIYFTETALIPLRSTSLDVQVGLRFESVALPVNALINNATLSVHTSTDWPVDLSSTVTIYGIDVSDLEPFETEGSGNFSYLPLTTASVVWNVSGVYGTDDWFNVSVTEIVQELVIRYGWVSGNDLGFKIVGSSDPTRREFDAYDYAPWRAARLYVTHSVAPSTPQAQASGPYNDPTIWTWTWWRHYRCYDIWNVSSFGQANIDYTWLNGTNGDLYYDNFNRTGPPLFIQDVEATEDLNRPGQRRVLRTEDDVVFVVNVDDTNASGNKEVWIFNSTDGGLTFGPGTLLSNLPTMGSYGQVHVDLDIDSSGNLHVVWVGQITGHTAPRIFYMNYTVTGWSTPVNVTGNNPWGNEANMRPVIEFDGSDNLHLAFSADNVTQDNYHQVYYMNRTTGWSSPIKISTVDLGNQFDVNLVLGNETVPNVYLVWVDYRGGGQRYLKYRFRISGAWGAEAHVSTVGDNVREKPFVVIDGNQTLHCVFEAYFVAQAKYRVYYVRWNGVAWVDLTLLSTDNTDDFRFPCITIDQNSTLHVMMSELDGTPDLLYYRNRTLGGSWSSIAQIQNATVLQYPNMPELSQSELVQVNFVSQNGTLVDPDPVDDPEEIIDDLLPPDPEDPGDPGEWAGWLTINRTKMIFLVIGLGLVLVPPIWAVKMRAFADEWVIVIFLMLIGYSLMSFAQYIG